MDILNQEINLKYYFVIFVFMCSFSCNDNDRSSHIEKSKEQLGDSEYKRIYSLISDTLQKWSLNHILGSPDSTQNIIYIDSLLCFNLKQNRLISSLLIVDSDKASESTADGIFYFYGEKIANQWYFFKGPYIHIPRDIVKNHNIHTPLSYQQLHQIALKEVYSGYLNRNGEINENWFTSKFEGNGWVNWDDTPEKIKSYTRKDYEQFHLRKVRGNWYGVKKDSIIP
ncbi:MAG: hypothetical protein H0W61_12560 [Bacteroidetes bacterium]|nr:hypothetical protein [Bacteroidota bacterium]